MSYPAISLSTATVGRHRCPQKRLQTARQPPVYPNSSPDHRACNSLTHFRCPHAVHSCPSVDSGLELALACDIRIATEDALLGLPEVRVGVPSVIEASLLPQTIGLGRARNLLLTGDTVNAQRSLEIGLVDRLAPKERLLDQAYRHSSAIFWDQPGRTHISKRHYRQVVGVERRTFGGI